MIFYLYFFISVFLCLSAANVNLLVMHTPLIRTSKIYYTGSKPYVPILPSHSLSSVTPTLHQSESSPQVPRASEPAIAFRDNLGGGRGICRSPCIVGRCAVRG